MRSSKRDVIIGQLKGRLSMPRVQISVILGLTAFTAFIVAAVLLHEGMRSMALRYPIAVAAGYGAFLGLLRIWIWMQSEEAVGDVGIDAVIDPGIANIDLGGAGAVDSFGFGGDCDFAGAGAGGAWPDGDVPTPATAAFVSSSSPAASGSSASSGIGFDLDDGLGLVIVAIVLVLVFGALAYVVWIAPVLLAELLIDAAVVGSLYRPVKNIQRQYWLLTALKTTAVPAVIVAVLFFVAGLVMQAAEPDAVTIGQFLKSVIG